MVRARKLGALTPVPYAVDLQGATISMERVAGSTVKALLHSGALAGTGAIVCASAGSRQHAGDDMIGAAYAAWGRRTA